jgi:hypothetical protein
MFSSSSRTTTTSKQHGPMFPMLGTELDVLAPFRQVWPALRVLVDKIDAVTVPTSFKVAIGDLFSEFWASTNASGRHRLQGVHAPYQRGRQHAAQVASQAAGEAPRSQTISP